MANWVRYPPTFLSVSPPWRACEVEVRYSPPPQTRPFAEYDPLCVHPIPEETKGRFCKGRFRRMCPHSGFLYRRSVFCTLVPAFVIECFRGRHTGGRNFTSFFAVLRTLLHAAENEPFLP